ncbi:MAG: LytR/AlgR family response regulator transcription factor [Nocardioidaceae bacterium]
MTGLRILVVDDEQPALDELAFLLDQDDRVATVTTVASGAQALRELEAGDVDGVFLDIAMPGLSGLDVARVLTRFRTPPRIVFITAHEDHAIEAFTLNAVDYLLKPVRAERLREAVRRLVDPLDPIPPAGDEMIPVELAGVTRFVSRRDVRYVEAHGDYARLHTGSEQHLVRVPLTALAEQWAEAGFLRIHRSLLVATSHVREVRVDDGRCTVVVALDGSDTELGVARRHTRELRDVLVRNARPHGRQP